jgi:ribosomal-protein-alanine N-acetyltransferase
MERHPAMEIVTPRFLLRDFVETDRPAFLAYHADPRYRALTGPDGSTPERARRLFEAFQVWASEHPRLNYQLAIVRRREPQALVGCCGLRAAECEPGRAELGIELAPAYWGRHGYAVEVGRALLDFGFGRLGLREITGVTGSANARVARLAKWFGAETVGTSLGTARMSVEGSTETVRMSARGSDETGWMPTQRGNETAGMSAQGSNETKWRITRERWERRPVV